MNVVVIYSLGLDIGTNSIGWCLIGYSPNGDADRIIDMGARIFSDGREDQGDASLAVARRENEPCVVAATVIYDGDQRFSDG